MNKEYLKNPPKKYRPAPFWSWNEKLNTEETVNQINEMENAGIGGFFMHARGGLQTEYMSDEWFENITASSKRANETGMLAWGYDENGWPSGFGNGAVNGLGLKYQQKYLRGEITNSPKNTKHTITNILGENGKNYHMYFDVNPFYVDVLDKNTVKKFLESTHDKYIEKLGKNAAGMTGFFTDEPQISRNGCPWSFIIEAEYKAKYNEELTPDLHKLLFNVDGCESVRYKFWELVRDLFTESYNKQIHNWHKEHNLLYTGHMACEEKFTEHMLSNGSSMPQYEYMDIPGMDHLCRELASIQTEMQLTSVANQLGKKQIMSETFALSGWNVSFEDLRWIYESQMVHGVNFLCQHLEGYSLRGIRKRDYPASLFIQQPWWKDYRVFNDTVSRIGMLIAEGSIDYNVLVLSTLDTAWITYNCSEETEDFTDSYNEKMIKVMENLENHQIQYHLGDDLIMKRHGKTEAGVLTVGTQNYKVVVVPPSKVIAGNTLKLLKEFKNAGGTVIFTEEIPTFVDGVKSDEPEILAKSSVVTDINSVYKYIPKELKKITLDYSADKNTSPLLTAVRGFEGDNMTMYYIVNPNNEKFAVTATVNGKSACIFNPITGEEEPVFFKQNGDKLQIETTLYEHGSVILFVYNNDVKKPLEKTAAALKPIADKLSENWNIVSADLNALTLDYCDLYFEGEEKGKNIPISDVQEMACDYFKEVKTDTVFHFNIKEMGFSVCNLAVETPDIFEISVNGTVIDKKDIGFFHDKSFRLFDIKDYLKLGDNTVKLSCAFVQSEKVYDNIKNAKIFESEKNKLTYDMELEAIYIVGDFGVFTDNTFKKSESRSLSNKGDFYIATAPGTVLTGNMAEQGFPFFAGSMTFKQNIKLAGDETKNRSFKINKLSSNVTSVSVNGKDAGKIMWRPYEMDISGLLKEGENEITVTVTGNLRNLLGPFHLKGADCFTVGPYSFFQNSPLWCKGLNENWTDDYCFVEYGLFI